MVSEFRGLPSVDKLLSEARLSHLQESFPRQFIVDLVRSRLQQERLSMAGGGSCPSTEELVTAICAEAHALTCPTLRPVINATGVILHTNLGRAALSEETRAAMDAVARGYCNLEFELDSGRRGSRQTHVEKLLCQLSGAEAALVVNNNASAVLLALTALAKRKEVIVSRSQAVEIGGGFRIPDVMRQSGAKLVEVGTTNCTYLSDYEEAIGPRTAALMRVHASNFRLTGFTHTVSLEELVGLGKQYDLPVFDDIGSGCLLDTTRFGLDAEPTLGQSISLGAGLVLSSADKLMGGPQAGVIVGDGGLVSRLKKHPLQRAGRIDKVRLAGLIATLIHYLKGEAVAKVPVWRMISAPLTEIGERAGRWAAAIGSSARVVEGETMVGGGSLPGGTLPTRLVAVGEEGRRKSSQVARRLGQRLSAQEVPIIGRISGQVLFLDPRSVLPEEDAVVLRALRDAAASLKLSR
ncbi:MAG TPA: L-seryl-tRNA(Sec) selenium transferase [Dehalococcoidia bacterium]|nr:L-seryl-tRNA(Sec) selenium transferase [Dehalococcoidia bacterium]